MISAPVIRASAICGGSPSTRSRLTAVSCAPSTAPLQKPKRSCLIAVCPIEKGRLLCGLDTFHRDPHMQLPPEGDDRLDDRFGFWSGAVEGAHETAVNLDLVEGEPPQI